MGRLIIDDLPPFPDTGAAEAFVRDPAYAPHAEARQAGSVSRFWIIDDSDALAVNIEPTGSNPDAPTTPVLGAVEI